MSSASSQRLYGRTPQVIFFLLIVGFVSFLALAVGCRRGGPEASQALAAALTAVRPLEGRLAGAPWLEPASPNGESEEVVRKAVRACSQALSMKVTAKTLRDDAIARLLVGQVDAAIEGLSKAARLAPADAVAWSDLAAARLQRSREARDPYELVLALAATNRAVRLDPEFEPARFNRALALERLSLHLQAAREWKFLAERERDRSWKDEVRRHATALAKRAATQRGEPDLARLRMAVEQGKTAEIRSMVAASPQRIREHLERELLPSWVRAESGGRKVDAARQLTFARAVADALSAVGGDRMIQDTIAHIDRIQEGAPREYPRLVEGFVAYFEGFDQLTRLDYSRALKQLKKAEEELSRQGSPFAGWAGFQVAFCQYQAADYGPARARALALAQVPASSGWKALQGRSFQMAGMIDAIEGRLTASVSAFEAGEAAFREIKEIPHAAKVSALMAGHLETLGQRQEAWRRLYRVLIEPAAQQRPDIWFAICEVASWLAQEQEETEIALWFQDEVVRSSGIFGPHASAGARRQRAVLLLTLGRRAEAAEDLKQARSHLQQIPDVSLRRSIEGDLLLVESKFAGPAAPEQWISRLDEAIRIFRETSYHYRLGDALFQRALANKALGRYDAAERDLAAAIAELEQQRETIDSAEHRISYLDRVKDIFDSMIELHAQRQRPAEALRVSEQAKARVLWDWMMAKPTQEPTLPHLQPAAAESFDLGAIQRDLPSGTAVVEYAVLPRKIVFWIVTGQGGLRWESSDISTAEVEDLTRNLRHAILEDRGTKLQPLAEKAYDLLIRPVERHLAPGERLVLIPDGPLHALPLAVLRNRETGRYLFQERVLTVAPSIRVYLESRRRDMALVRGPGNILVVTAPEFDRGIDPTLLPLKAGQTETAIVGTFPGRVLRGREATRKVFLQVAPDFEFVYFGGHSVVNAEHPLLSQMLFAKDSTDPSRGVLYSGDVLRQSFPRTRLVVLASCGTAFGKISRTEGVENLARPFLAAGVPLVVASLWSVEDQVTAEFFVRFYRNLKQNLDVAEALQATQIESFNHGLSPRAWAAFVTIGGERRSTDPPGAAE